jgi:L-alanine-DL-glutamate epimerase-like enolase superfamily enzyme
MEHRREGDEVSGTVEVNRSAPGKSIRIRSTNSNFEREPLIRPFGFKGGYLTEAWQTAALMESESGIKRIGVSTQSVLWSDASVFQSNSEPAGNALMYAMTERALRAARGSSFRDPIELLENVLEDVYDYGRRITGLQNLRKTFALNALVAFDNSAWLLYADENGMADFDAMIPHAYTPALANHHTQLASVPLMSYAVPIKEIEEAARQGYFLMKIKIGQPGSQQEMLEKDKARIEAIHKAIGGIETPHSPNGRIPYYFDANGRYEKEETLQRLLDHARAIKAFDQIVLLEEPFPEEYEEDVSDLGVRIAADESAHTDKDARRRIEMGYGAIALKPIAKTLSMSLKIANVAQEKGIPCFCADLTVNPILVDWNKNVAARLAPFPGLGLGILETNGHQNYRHWNKMIKYHPCAGASWMETEKGVFNLNEDFYSRSGGIFLPSRHYWELVERVSGELIR